MEKKIFIDVETSGLSEYRNYIIQIAAIADVPHCEPEEFNIWLEVPEDEQLPEMLLKALGLEEADLRKRGVKRKEAFQDFKNFLENYIDPYDKTDKFYFYAYSSPFDAKFLRALWKEHNDKFFGSFFWTPDICIMRKACEEIGNDRIGMPDFKQASVATKLGIEFNASELHDAMVDVRLAREIYYKLKEGR